MSNNNFIWRPNDNGSVTNVRYSIEAEKWVGAVNSAQNKLPKGDFIGDMGFVGALIQLPLLLIFFILMIPIAIIREVFKFNIKIFPGDEPTGKILTHREKFDARMDYLHKKFPNKKQRDRKPGDEIPSKFEDMTQEDIQRVVAMVRAETARAKNNLEMNM